MVYVVIMAAGAGVAVGVIAALSGASFGTSFASGVVAVALGAVAGAGLALARRER